MHARETAKKATTKFEPRKEPKLQRFFTFGEKETNGTSKDADASNKLSRRESASLAQLCNGDSSSPSESENFPSGCSSSSSRRERKRNLSEINGGKMGEKITTAEEDEVGVGPQSQEQSRLSFDGQMGDGYGSGGGGGGCGPDTLSRERSDAATVNGTEFEKSPSAEGEQARESSNNDGMFGRQQESGTPSKSDGENGQEGLMTIKAQKEEEKEEEDSALISKTECAGLQQPEIRFAEEEVKRGTPGSSEQGAGQTIDHDSKATPAVVGLSRNSQISESHNFAARRELNFASKRSEEEVISMQQFAAGQLRRPVHFMTMPCSSYGGTALKGPSRSGSRSPVPSPSPIRKYLNEGSKDNQTVAEEARAAVPPDEDIEGSAPEASKSYCNTEMRNLEVRETRTVEIQETTVSNIFCQTAVYDASKGVIARDEDVPKSNENADAPSSDKPSVQVQQPAHEVQINNEIGVDTVAAASTQLDDDEIVEMGPENVKIHESVIPRITTRSSYYTAATSIANETSWAEETKMKGDLFASLLKVKTKAKKRSEFENFLARSETFSFSIMKHMFGLLAQL